MVSGSFSTKRIKHCFREDANSDHSTAISPFKFRSATNFQIDVSSAYDVHSLIRCILQWENTLSVEPSYQSFREFEVTCWPFPGVFPNPHISFASYAPFRPCLNQGESIYHGFPSCWTYKRWFPWTLKPIFNGFPCHILGSEDSSPQHLVGYEPPKDFCCQGFVEPKQVMNSPTS